MRRLGVCGGWLLRVNVNVAHHLDLHCSPFINRGQTILALRVTLNLILAERLCLSRFSNVLRGVLPKEISSHLYVGGFFFVCSLQTSLLVISIRLA